MAKKRTQYRIGIIRAEEMIFLEKNKLVFEAQNYALKTHRSKEVMTSGNRVFRMFCPNVEMKEIAAMDENNQPVMNEDGTPMTMIVPVKLAAEFTVVDMSKCEDMSIVTKLLKDGFYIRHMDGSEVHMELALRSPSQVRQGKGLFSSLDVNEIRTRATFNMDIAAMEVISKVLAHEGLSMSSTIEIDVKKDRFSFDILPDYEITRNFDVEEYDEKTMKLVSSKQKELKLSPLDGQGTIKVTAAIRVAHRLELISKKEREYAIELYEDVQFLKLALADQRFASIWSRVPSAFQIRFAQTKGLLVVYEHQHESTDCNGDTVRKTGKAMKFWKQLDRKAKSHAYDFDADMLFTDSMWKRGFDPKYIDIVPLEIVLYQKSRRTEFTFMGYQYWQALKDVNIKNFAAREARKLSDTILSNAGDALAFLNMMDSGEETSEEYEMRMQKAGSKIQKIIEVLHENPEMIEVDYIQKGLRSLKEKFIEDMAGGRIPVKGANPYIATAVECMFGRESKLQAGENYYNGRTHRYAGFRSPLIHKSEAVIYDTVDVDDYAGLFRDLLILNPYDDSLPRMGGADTDGDRIAITDNEEVIAGVEANYVNGKPLPMLYDKGGQSTDKPVNKQSRYEFNLDTVQNDAPTIGEITNMASSWKDIAENPAKLRELNMSAKQVDTIVKILRFMQGWSIDFAKTGYFPKVPRYVNTKRSPHWLPWSRGQVAAGIKNAEVYQSESQLGVLYTAIKGADGKGGYLQKYKAMETKQDKERKYRDFFFEMTDHADKAEEKRILPMVQALYNAYNKELQSLRDLKLDEEQHKEYMSHIFDKYQRAITSLDADISSIAAAAYRVAYAKSKSKRKAVSFPWVVCYEGLLINIAASSNHKLKLKKVDFEGHIDDIPNELKFYRCQSSTEDYSVMATVKNGTYRVHRKNGNLYIEVGHKGLDRAKGMNVVRPEERHLPFPIVGFTNNNQTAASVIEILKETDGIIVAKRVADAGRQKENRIGIFAEVNGELTRICSAGVGAKDLIGDYLPCVFKVNNVDALEPTFLAKKSGKVETTKAFNLDTTYVSPIDADADEVVAMDDDSYEDGYGYDRGDDYGYYADPMDEAQYSAVEVDFDDEDYGDMDIEDDADELLIEDLKEKLNIVAAECDTMDDAVTVTLTNARGKKLVVMLEGGEIAYDALKPAIANAVRGTDYETLIVMIAEREAYSPADRRKRA